MNLGNIIQWQRKIGAPIYHQDNLVIRPISRILTIWWQPFGGSVHNWPVAVQIEENGTVRELPINNINLWVQIGTSLIIILSSLLMWKIDKRQS